MRSILGQSRLSSQCDIRHSWMSCGLVLSLCEIKRRIMGQGIMAESTGGSSHCGVIRCTLLSIVCPVVWLLRLLHHICLFHSNPSVKCFHTRSSLSHWI